MTARPAVLRFDPGNGDSAVACPGPGRPWTAADGNAAPTGGGCGYVYPRTTLGSAPLTATVSIVWTVSWAGSDGTSGAFAGLRTDAASSLIVEQIQTVNR